MSNPREDNVVATMKDRFGDTRRIYRKGKNGSLQIEKNSDTVSHLLNRVAAVLIGARIKARREKLALTLADLCVKAGLKTDSPKERMWEIENAIRQHGVRLGTLYAIAKALRCEARDLLPDAAEVLEHAGVQERTTSALSVTP